MYWQPIPVPIQPAAAPLAWIPRAWLPESARRQTQTQGQPASEPSEEHQYIAAIEAMLRLILTYPGLPDELAAVIPVKPGQSREAHFDVFMEALSSRARFHPGLGVAIADTLEPFLEEARRCRS